MFFLLTLKGSGSWVDLRTPKVSEINQVGGKARALLHQFFFWWVFLVLVFSGNP